ncbi:AMP-dependent synthetase/ligase [Streptomyces sp. DSM 44917]|uniref:AMP-dependent synthetase/ligase n=1 Tax=Streptomyces boetiae TaxID=3075541 RepID=A0ABU2LEP3_9ACTN|nr:AMP-dependent synthetase/ligase [Streptomyces sp. DSM 44917]MDT0309971.1 AMP-dependent synthetase/ligase [Streptomyces sp. DSM 44917]
MGARQDLKRAKSSGHLGARVKPEVVRENGVVREVRIPPLVTPPTKGSIADVPFANAAQEPRAVVIRRKVGGRYEPVTAAEFAREVTDVAKGLIASGLGPGGRVAVMARTCYEWAVLDFAIWAAGGQTVPIYATSSADQVEWILRDSSASAIVVENADHAAAAETAISDLARDLPQPRLWQIDAGALSQLTELGRGVPDSEVDQRRALMTPETIATLVYTSGTTGRPKGCVLTHGNLHAEAANLVELLKPVFEEVTKQTASTLLFLPLAHILGRTIQIACLMARIEIGHCPSIKPDELRPELAAFQPTFLVGVPYLFEKIHDTGRATAEKIGRGSSFERANRIAVAYGKASLAKYLGTGPGPGLGLSAARLLYDLLVYRRIRTALGGRVRYAISGGSPLDSELNYFFFGCGIVIYEGYGLTETTAAATLIPPLDPRPGTVGQPVPGSAIRIGEDGEVLIKGGTVFGSYWNNPAATKEVLDADSWFATGDIGALDEDGYLTITGRKKDIIITNGGKNVSPAVLEDRLRSRPPVGQCMVVGDGRAFIGALVTLDPEAMDHWLSVRKRPRDTPLSELRNDKELQADIQRAVDYANEAVSRAESIRKFLIVDGDFTEENGLLTPSLKVKRKAVAETYAKDIEELYGG